MSIKLYTFKHDLLSNITLSYIKKIKELLDYNNKIIIRFENNIQKPEYGSRIYANIDGNIIYGKKIIPEICNYINLYYDYLSRMKKRSDDIKSISGNEEIKIEDTCLENPNIESILKNKPRNFLDIESNYNINNSQKSLNHHEIEMNIGQLIKNNYKPPKNINSYGYQEILDYNK